MEKHLENIHYETLIIYAKKLGIRSPEKLAKTDLIEEIKSIEFGNKIKELNYIDKKIETEFEKLKNLLTRK